MAVLIKRYANRKLYNTETSRYITLKGVSELVHAGREIRVVDNESGREITPVILSQILVDDQRRPDPEEGAVPGRLLSELIQRGGDALYSLLRRGLDDAQDNLSEARQNVRRLLQSPELARFDAAELSRLVHRSVERVLGVMDLPTRGDIEALNHNLERLAHALETFEARAAAPARPKASEEPRA
jgi:polyhydroxyalkanoate synthesis repressor PhaR